MNIKAIIFDMDGVLVDSEKVITKAAILALSEWGIKLENLTSNNSLEWVKLDLLVEFPKLYGVPFELKMKERTYSIYTEIVDDEIILYDGIKELIEYLKQKQYKVALASSADLIKVKANLNAAKIPLNMFDTYICGDMVENKKPAPDIFLMAADNINISYENCFVVEDALSGIIATKTAHMKCAAVMSSFNEKIFLPLKPDYIIKNTIDLRNIL